MSEFIAATYNIHRCIGRDGRQDPDRIVEVIRETDAVIVGLQEVESIYHSEPRRHQLEYIGQATGLQVIPGPVVLRADSDYGNSLLTNAQVIDIRRHDISVPGREARGALDVNLKLHDSVVRVIVTHLGLSSAERRFQARQLLHQLISQPHIPTLLMGDFNEWFRCSRVLRWLAGHFGAPSMRPTFPARFPLFALDRIMLRPTQILKRLHVHYSPMARIASDHLPLTAQCELGELA